MARLETRIGVLEQANRKLSIAPLLEAGEFNTIAEGLDEADVAMREGKIGEFFGKAIDKLPGWGKTTVKQLAITKDTALYQGLTRGVQYGDFIAKAVLYDHLTKKKGLTREEALDRVLEEFIPYNRLSGAAVTRSSPWVWPGSSTTSCGPCPSWSAPCASGRSQPWRCSPAAARFGGRPSMTARSWARWRAAASATRSDRAWASAPRGCIRWGRSCSEERRLSSKTNFSRASTLPSRIEKGPGPSSGGFGNAGIISSAARSSPMPRRACALVCISAKRGCPGCSWGWEMILEDFTLFGAVPATPREGHQVIVRPMSKNDELVKTGYVQTGIYSGDSSDGRPEAMAYYQTVVGGQGAFRQGVAQTVNDTWQGVDARTGLTLAGNVAGTLLGARVALGLADRLKRSPAGSLDGLSAGEWLMAGVRW